MHTPWGPLTRLDLTDSILAEQIVCSDKHRLVEGLIVECLFDQIFKEIPEDGQLVALDVETIVVDPGNGRQFIAFVWTRSIPKAGLGRYLEALGRKFVPYLISFEAGVGFLAQRREGRNPAGDQLPLTKLVEAISGRAPQTFQVDSSVREPDRLRQAFWGFISGHYGPQVGERVVLPRLLINWGIQPYFNGVWNLDRVFICGNDIWLLEVKHKFPWELPPKGNLPTLRFGINTGELEVINRLEQAGIRCLFTILVKPIWSAKEGAAKLLTKLTMRERMALIGVNMDQKVFAELSRQKARRAPPHTAIDGSSDVEYKTLPATRFSSFGNLGNKAAEIAAQLLNMMSGQRCTRVQEGYLRSLQVTAENS